MTVIFTLEFHIKLPRIMNCLAAITKNSLSFNNVQLTRSNHDPVYWNMEIRMKDEDSFVMKQFLDKEFKRNLIKRKVI